MLYRWLVSLPLCEVRDPQADTLSALISSITGCVRIPDDSENALQAGQHANAVRQAAAFGDVLVAGVHSDEEIERNKGPPVLTLEERAALLKACRWVDEVVPDAPYVTDVDYIKRHNIDFVVHGDDGARDAYNGVIEAAAGMYKECKRTEGVSTTDAISRVLTGASSEPAASTDQETFRRLLVEFAKDKRHPDDPIVARRDSESADWQMTLVDDFVTDIKEGEQLYVGQYRPPFPAEQIIFSASDGPNPQEVEQWRQTSSVARRGVIIAVLSDEAIQAKTGRPPIFRLQERALSVLQCRTVGGVMLPAQSSSFDVAPSFLYKRIEDRRPALEARQARKLGKSAVEKDLKSLYNAN